MDTDGDGTVNEFDEVVWEADYYDNSGYPGVWRLLWSRSSKDSKANRTVSGQNWVVTHGATGLIPGKSHRFRVGYCRVVGTVRGCSCVSAPTSSYTRATTFPDVKPDPPASTTQRMDDNFHRPYQTTPKRDGESVIGGDGLGADGAWEDSFVGTMGAGNGSYVKKSGTNASYAFMPQAVLANYSAVVAGHRHSYAEALFELEPDQTGGYYQYCSAASCRCWPEVQKAGTTSNPRPVRPDWLRIEVEDRTVGGTVAPYLIASVGWGDGENPCTAGIDSCPYKCTVSAFDDSSRGQTFKQLLGRWGVDTHERNYRVYRVRAGNQ